MIEISAIVLSLLIEAYVVLLVALITWFYIASKKKKKDRKAALKLVEQIKQQSEARHTSTSSYLKEKYKLEGPQLKKAIDSIDKSEKRFFQKVINLYLKRDSEALGTLDADVAELINTYKSLTPVATTDVNEDSEKDEQIELLQAANKQLSDELAITNKTMSDMIAEFGNMFGGGSDNVLEHTEVVEKVIPHHDNNVKSDEIDASQEAETGNSQQAEVDDSQQAEIDDSQKVEVGVEADGSGEEDVASEGDIDDILNGVISSDK